MAPSLYTVELCKSGGDALKFHMVECLNLAALSLDFRVLIDIKDGRASAFL